MEYAESKAYTIKIQNFEGPLDLLFHLIERNQMDIYDIAIHEITEQYMDYLFQMQEMDLEIASEFLVMAATLLLIKSRMLLPDKKEKKTEEETDPRDELVHRLVEYKKYKELSAVLAERGKIWESTFTRLPEVIQVERRPEPLKLEPEELARCYSGIMERNESRLNKNVKNINVLIQHEKVSITSKINEIIRSLARQACIKFNEIFSVRKKSRVEVVTGFLAILELARVKKVALEQKQQFGEILIYKRSGAEEIERESEAAWK